MTQTKLECKAYLAMAFKVCKLKLDGVCHPVRNVLCRAGCRGLAQNVSDGVANPVALRRKSSLALPALFQRERDSANASSSFQRS